MDGFLRAFTLEFAQIWCPVRPPGIWVDERYVHIVPAELGEELLHDRTSGAKDETRKVSHLSFHWLRPVTRDGTLVLEASDPYVPTVDEVRTDAALVIFSAQLREGQFAVWKFPEEAQYHGERSEKDHTTLVSINCLRHLLEIPCGTSAECYVCNSDGSLARHMRFNVKKVRTSRSRGRPMYDRSGERCYKWGHQEVFWPWVERLSLDPSETELPEDVRAMIVDRDESTG